ncbi:MAG: WYL domain-containing protein [Ilumatobacteraceae bacterium]|nr:WYL domain-containing protein [Ilumatobacteraceae bacterium]
MRGRNSWRRHIRKRGPRSAKVRVQNALHIMPWVMERGGSTVEEIAQQFGLTKEEVLEDLSTAMVCGVPPYGGGDMIDIVVFEDGTVEASPSQSFYRTLELTHVEIFGLSVLADAAAQLPGMRRDKRLASAIAKLRDFLGGDVVDVETEQATYLDVVWEAAEKGQKLEIEYLSPSKDVATQRTITPRTVFSDAGHWYTVADDDLSNESRTFRIDRIQDVRVTGETVEIIATTALAPLWFPDDGTLPVVRAHLKAAAAWVVESYPCRDVTENDDGSFEISIVVNSPHWLGRLALRAGSNIVISKPVEFIDIAQRTAQTVLSRYLVASESAD